MKIDFIIDDMHEYIQDKIDSLYYQILNTTERGVKAVRNNGMIVGTIPKDFLSKREENAFISLVENYIYLKEQLKRFKKKS